MARVFISHSSRDEEQAARLLEWLHARGFTETFLDFDKHAGIMPGRDWERTLYREIARAEAVIVILTANWFESKWCFAEFAQARALGKAIFPVIESPKGETFIAQDIQSLDLLKDREGGLERLASELTRIALDARGGFPWDATRPVFPGLLSFDEADAAIYFGRDDDIRRVIERLNARRAQGGERLLVLLGASGAGKSSLLRAGVLPRLKHDRQNWIVLPPFRPRFHPLDELAQALATALGGSKTWREWRDGFAAGDPKRTLSDLAHDLRARNGANEAQILISVDQAEELFAAADRAEVERFFALLDAALDERLPFLVLMALRSDYLDRLQQVPALAVKLDELSLRPMPLERVRAIIEGPARVAGLDVEDALTVAAMKDAATDDALPLLAFALRELYDRFGGTGHLTLEAYRALGDPQSKLSPLENAVRRKAEEVLSQASPAPEDLSALREAFVPALVRVNAEGEYVRRSAPLESLPEKARPLIERLAKARLLVLRQEAGSVAVEVAHEALLRKWPTLRGWLDEEREFLIGKDQLEIDLREWEKTPDAQKSEALLTGLKLTRARSWLAEKPRQLTEAERKFAQASIDHHEAELARRERLRRRVQIGTAAAAAVLAVLAGFAWWERDIAEGERVEAERNYALALDQAAFSVPLLVDSYREGAVSTDLMRQLIDHSEKALGSLRGDTDAVIAARIEVFDALGLANVELGDSANAQRFIERAVALAEGLERKDPANVPWVRLLARSRARLSDALFWKGDSAGALQQARAAAEATAKIAAANPDNEAVQQDLIDDDLRMGDILRSLGQLDAAAEADGDWVKIARGLAARHPGDLKWQISLASADADLGDTFEQKGDPESAAKLYKECVDISTGVLARAPHDVGSLKNLANCRIRSGDAALALGRPADAMPEYRVALDLAAKVSNADPANFEWRELLEVAHQRIGEVLLQQKDYPGALEEFSAYFALTTNMLARAPTSGTLLYDTANARLKIADALREKGDLAAAKAEYEKSLEIAQELTSRGAPAGGWQKLLAMDYQRLGLVFEAQDDLPSALAQFDKCAGVPVNKFVWTPRTLWPPDVTAFCRQEIAAPGRGSPGPPK